MQLIIDGHNLIPHLPGINLSDLDDEDQLVNWLMQYCRLKRSKAHVFFDQAPIGHSGVKTRGSVTVHYVPQGRIADDAIKAYLKKLGKAARNVTVVSSDRQVTAAAHSYHTGVITSEAFAREMTALSDQVPEIDPRSRQISDEEVRRWEALFKGKQTPNNYAKSDKNSKL